MDTTTLDLVRTLVATGEHVTDIARTLRLDHSHRVESAFGANMFALVFPTMVIKWKQAYAYHASSGNDVVFYDSVSSEDRQHFAKCSQDGEFIIQERCVELADVRSKFDEMTHPQQRATILIWLDLALRYNLFDLHEENIGFRMDDDTLSTPVIFDYSGQKNLSGIFAMDGAERVEGYLNLPCWICHEPEEIRKDIKEAIIAFYAD